MGGDLTEGWEVRHSFFFNYALWVYEVFVIDNENGVRWGLHQDASPLNIGL